MNKITTIAQLLKQLSESSDNQLKSIYQLLEIPLKEFEPYLFWSEENYTRNCIIRTERYELILICWEKGQFTPIHSHNEQECWVYNVKGKFKEIRFMNDENGIPQQVQYSVINQKNRSYMNDRMGFHILKNKANGRSASLHLYAKPIDECLVYNETHQLFELKPLHYYSVSGKIINAIEN